MEKVFRIDLVRGIFRLNILLLYLGIWMAYVAIVRGPKSAWEADGFLIPYLRELNKRKRQRKL